MEKNTDNLEGEIPLSKFIYIGGFLTNIFYV